MWPDNAQSMYLIVNKNETNKFGEPRGYRIMPGEFLDVLGCKFTYARLLGRGGGMHLTITNSSNLLNSQSFATHHLYVTKQKDTEVRLFHPDSVGVLKQRSLAPFGPCKQ